jgi:hypothetical protein
MDGANALGADAGGCGVELLESQDAMAGGHNLIDAHCLPGTHAGPPEGNAKAERGQHGPRAGVRTRSHCRWVHYRAQAARVK